MCFTAINNWSQVSGRVESHQQVSVGEAYTVPKPPRHSNTNYLSSSSQSMAVIGGGSIIWRKSYYKGEAKGPLHTFFISRRMLPLPPFDWKKMCRDCVFLKSSLWMCLMCMCVSHMYALTDVLACACGGQKSAPSVFLYCFFPYILSQGAVACFCSFWRPITQHPNKSNTEAYS